MGVAEGEAVGTNDVDVRGVGLADADASAAGSPGWTMATTPTSVPTATITAIASPATAPVRRPIDLQPLTCTASRLWFVFACYRFGETGSMIPGPGDRPGIGAAAPSEPPLVIAVSGRAGTPAGR